MEAGRKERGMMNVLLFPTMRCNLKCSYCHFRVDQHKTSYEWEGYGKAHKVSGEVKWTDLVAFLKKVGPAHIEFSGGEPTLYRGFKELVANIPHGSRWAITSNTLIDPKGTDLSKCMFWTASYHAGGNREKFIENVKWLRDNYGRVAVSFVVPFADVDKTLIKALEYRSDLGVQVNLLRELNPGISWTDTEEWKKLEAMKHFGFNVVEDDIPESYEFSGGWLCHGGESYVAVMPCGNVYRCYSEAMDGEPIGTIWDFEPDSEPYECHRDCYGCAADHKARIAKLIGD
jgi:MoaA/NifB/PqqE/SkfB family radical SAM enzyme